MNILVSACLLGAACRYDGGARLEPRVAALLTELAAVAPILGRSGHWNGGRRHGHGDDGGLGKAVHERSPLLGSATEKAIRPV